MGCAGKRSPHQPPAGGSFSPGEKPKGYLLFKKGDISWFLSQSTARPGPVNPVWPRRWPKDLGYIYVDTGAMYRSIGLYAVRAGADPRDADAVAALLPGIKLDIRLLDGTQHVYLNGEDVSTAIRAENIGMAASAVAAHPAVRAFLLDTQRGLAESQNILMDGRDIGTVVLPNATVKIFLTATAEARAERRAKELADKGQPADLATVLADIRQRDYQDSHRAVAPLKQAEDAILVDTSDIGLQESFDLLKRTILAHI